MIVAKFGGTSVSTKSRIANICDIIRARLARKPVVVVSAVSGITDLLLSITRSPKRAESRFRSVRNAHARLIRDIWEDKPSAINTVMARIDVYLREAKKTVKKQGMSKQDTDRLIAFGEIMSSYLITEALKKSGIAAEQVIASEFVVTNDEFGKAEFLPVETRARTRERLLPLIEKGTVPVVTGFIGATKDGCTTTLGRGGSDYTAAILGSALETKLVEIWTDVDGIMTTDPRIVSGARTVPELAFEEACELAYFGAKVIHPKTILPAIAHGIPIKILNTLKPGNTGTTIISNFAKRRWKSHTVEAFTFKKKVTLIHVRSPEFFTGEGLMARIFSLFEQNRTSIDLVATSIAGVSLTIDDETNLETILAGLKELGEVTVKRGKAVVCVVGGSVNAAKVAGQMFTTLSEGGIQIEMISQAAAGVSMTFVTEEDDVEHAIKILHKTYIGKR